ncbi:dehydrogenase [Alicyclobacillus cellulosilyticus]|uniref:Dehydrogenase n=1 Tax=Alicyclobacillus cellulosilyticus TaxID=1003997 RepID=A0A917K8W6_9BACL|nr:D-2-hydroxyacid dehydrogenase [Alicyclobacillus cellulosilyticus]GGJ05467.1 dehydrogenase [Alicyclobacillus cellulosilyticus]
MSSIHIVFNYRGEWTLPADKVSELKAAFPDVTFIEAAGREVPPEVLQEADAFVGWPTDEMLDAMPKLRWLQLPSAGANGYADNPKLRPEVVLTNSSGVFGIPGAEHAIALMMAFARRIHIHRDQQHQRVWKPSRDCLQVQDATVLVVGLGDIGKEVAVRAKALGAHVIGVKRQVTTSPPYVDELYDTAHVDDVLPHADFVVSALPLTPETRGFFSAERFAKFKPGAVFVNIGRGGSVDESALVAALSTGRLGGAGLDVTAEEPLPPDNPLWGLENVIITSHSAGVSPTKTERRFQLLERNIRRFVNGERLENVVDRKLGY